MTASPDNRDSYDMTPHDDTWRLFTGLAKWTIILTVILLVFMALFLTGGHPPAH